MDRCGTASRSATTLAPVPVIHGQFVPVGAPMAMSRHSRRTAVLAPNPFEKPLRLDTATVHKASMIVATAGMATQIVLGIVTASREGRVSQRDDVLTIQVELVEVETGARLWGEPYHRKFADIVLVQEEIEGRRPELATMLAGRDAVFVRTTMT